MAGVATYGIAALAAGLFGWWWMGRPVASSPTSQGGATPGGPSGGSKPPPKVYADRATAQADWTAGALDGAADGYDAGAAGTKAGDYHPEANVTFPASAVSFKAYANGFLCGSRTGFRLGQRARSMFGASATSTHFDTTNLDSRKVVTDACADGFAAWFAAHGAEPIEPRSSGASVGAVRYADPRSVLRPIHTGVATTVPQVVACVTRFLADDERRRGVKPGYLTPHDFEYVMIAYVCAGGRLLTVDDFTAAGSDDLRRRYKAWMALYADAVRAYGPTPPTTLPGFAQVALAMVAREAATPSVRTRVGARETHPSSRAAYAHRPLPPAPVSRTLGTSWVTRAAPHRVY